ncbi:MAG: hypothetical protein Q8J76_14900, partial [Desulfobulbaceae bacterium]|nr:hypothetical protein [Desulfobulbaceae bacterium]
LDQKVDSYKTALKAPVDENNAKYLFDVFSGIYASYECIYKTLLMLSSRPDSPTKQYILA